MWIDQRIQGRLRELILESEDISQSDVAKALILAEEAVACAKERGDPYEITVASRYVGRVLNIRGDLNEAKIIYTKVIEYAESAGEYWLLAGTYQILSECYQISYNLEHAERLCNLSIQLCEEYNFQDILPWALAKLSEIYRVQGRSSAGLDAIYRARDIFNRTPPEVFADKSSTNLELVILDILGSLLASVGDYENALKVLQQIIEVAVKYEKTRPVVQAYNNMGFMYNVLGDFEKAIECNLKALEVLSRVPNTPQEIGCYHALAYNYIRIGEFEKAEQVNERAISLAGSIGDRFLGGILYDKGKIMIARADPEGIHILTEALAMKRSMGDRTDLKELLEDISSFYKNNGDFVLALQYHEEYLQVIKEDANEKQAALSRIEMERYEQQKKIFTLELENKQAKLQHQERELALTASQLASQADLLSHFRNDLRKIVRDMADPIDALRHIKQKLKDLPCEQIDWAKFEAEFVAVHPEFRSLLGSRFPDLTPQETKMCMLARLGLKNAEIARLTCLSERSVENHRFNLRKKLGLKTEQRLSEFLVTIR